MSAPNVTSNETFLELIPLCASLDGEETIENLDHVSIISKVEYIDEKPKPQTCSWIIWSFQIALFLALGALLACTFVYEPYNSAEARTLEDRKGSTPKMPFSQKSAIEASISSNLIQDRETMRKSNSNCLVIAFSSIRGGDPAARSMQKHLLHPLGCDLAIYVGKDERNRDTMLWQISNYTWEIDELEDWGDVFTAIDPSERWHRLLSVGHQVFGGVLCNETCIAHCLTLSNGGKCSQHEGSAGILLAMRYLIQKKIEILGLHKKYEKFILTRTDHLYLCDHVPIASFEDLAVVDGEKYGGYTDRHWVVPASKVLQFLNVTFAIVSQAEFYAPTMPGRNLESTLKWWTDLQRMPVDRFNRTMASIKEHDIDKSRWSLGQSFPSRILDSNRYWVAYPNAMRVAKDFCGSKNTEIRLRQQ